MVRDCWAAIEYALLTELKPGTAIIEADRAAVEAATIAKVVAWLRKEAPAALHDPRMVASAIEAGEWKQ